MTVHNSSNGKIGQSPRVPAFARETKMKNMRRGHVSAILVREGVQRMCFSQKSDLFFRFEKLGVRRKSPVSPAAFSTPFHAGGPHRGGDSVRSLSRHRRGRHLAERLPHKYIFRSVCALLALVPRPAHKRSPQFVRSCVGCYIARLPRYLAGSATSPSRAYSTSLMCRIYLEK